MRLYNFCLNCYQDGTRARNNGLFCEPENILMMLDAIYKSYLSGLPNTDNAPKLMNLIAMEMSENGTFNHRNLADMIALVFDTMTELNMNPTLWLSELDKNSEANHIFMVLIHGPDAHIIQNAKGAFSGGDYSEVKAKLISDLEQPLNRHLY
ncbi:hypothetical protein [Pantoea ananatis]|uniref:hypothetical protein n=1 Tax=Pantoea ananas TaxID=553 RepID=UPI001B3029D2|nr:hypothetical protein [Pantoea ananatis]